MTSNFFEFSFSGQNATVSPKGVWRIENITRLSLELANDLRNFKDITVDGQALTEIDTAGAMVLWKIVCADGGAALAGKNISLINFRAEHLSLIELVRDRLSKTPVKHGLVRLSIVQKVGQGAINFYEAAKGTISFLGQSVLALLEVLVNPKKLRVKELFVQMELGCIDAIPIVALVTFLIGVVIAYLSAVQIEKVGANIFIVDGVSLAMCRELSPLIVAILVAGRSGSAYTAQIGTMKLNEEVDALITLGLSPMQVLVVPRILALALAMPLLVFVGDIVGIAGGMFIAENYLGVTSTTFIERLQTVLRLKSFYVGLVKAPVFAAFIAIIGCRLGLTVENNARSVGIHTTSTVVQSIVAVILLNAAFAVIFVELGI